MIPLQPGRFLRERAAAFLLALFAFSAWSLTGLAHACLFLLLALFLAELPRHWQLLSRDPACRLLIGVTLATTLLAWRAAQALPDTAADQWREIWDWSSPFLFVVVAWWVRGESPMIGRILIAACLGILLGVIRKTDWSLMGEVLQGMRFDFGQSGLGLGFIASVVLLGLLLFRSRILSLGVAGRPRPAAGWLVWILALAAFFGIFVATQSRGAALGLILVGLSYGAYRAWRTVRGPGLSRPALVRIAVTAGLMLALTGVLVGTIAERFSWDYEQAAKSRSVDELSYGSSTATRINLYRIGLRLFAERPLLGWGPATSGTEYLVPAGVIPLSAYHRQNAPEWSHLHSVAIEVLVRFGLVGVLIAVWLFLVLGYGYRALWRARPEEGDPLRAFLMLGGILTLFYGLYDFRYVNVDIRFFLILFLGLVYGFVFRSHPGRPGGGGA